MKFAPRLAFVVSHPIQHFVPLYRALAMRDDLDIKVFLASEIGVKAYWDREMGATIAWAADLLEGYPREFLPGHERISETGFFRVDNPGVGRALANFEPDAVLLHGYAQLTQLRAFAWCRWRGVPILMTGDGDNAPRPSGTRKWLRQFVLRRLLRGVGAFLTVGDQNEAMLASLDVASARMFRAPLPIDELAYSPSPSRRAEIRASLGIAEDEFVVIFVGKLSPRKRPLDLVEAWARLPPEARRKIVLLFCGEGSERANLTRAVQSHGAPAVLAGFVNVDRLPGHLAAADVLAHPSERDPHPLICSEAACIGLPMILSDRVGAVGPTDIAREGENALVYRCGDLDGLGSSIARLRDDAALRGQMATRSRAIHEQCDLRATVDGLMRALESVAAKPTH